MMTPTSDIRFIRAGNTLINLSQIIDIIDLPGLVDSQGEIHIRTTAPDAEVHIFDGEQAEQLRALFNFAVFEMRHIYAAPARKMHASANWEEVSR